MSRVLEWTPAAVRDLRRLDPPVRERIRQAVYRFVDTGQGDVQRLQGIPREWRLRVGDWRVRFTEDPTGQTIVILWVRRRGEAYR
ncbi:MAG TPA: type II toxin-antitoxin system RelE/ParE family toxin [Candidatus Tectomicrobia bacterium]